MTEPSPHILELARRGAALRFRELLNELDLLLDLFPDLRDAFDDDELPVSFIVKKEASRGESQAVRRRKASAAAPRKAAGRRATQEWVEPRAGLKK